MYFEDQDYLNAGYSLFQWYPIKSWNFFLLPSTNFLCSPHNLPHKSSYVPLNNSQIQSMFCHRTFRFLFIYICMLFQLLSPILFAMLLAMTRFAVIVILILLQNKESCRNSAYAIEETCNILEIQKIRKK